ncbi:hypothetical protein PsAD2_02978 [Pseudovibrio axinellae]|uniref:Uncharacterized protein n=1 Tax=Pseudovibrio axinellae TaxID=989403 RepID=A0A165XEX4_9HYPH|nr:hypothetical protein [Pseudovibrio axinellae]KZL17642.1 hypothetical protein PsAD2_02978 [Pseudovibrio axinellae]SER45239.1 hypothetical protein SAMN05421798_110104 [Pseudovibrio axinellae]
MNVNGAVVEESLTNLEQSKIRMLLALQNNSRKLSAVMRKELFRLLKGKHQSGTATVVSNQIACQDAFKLLAEYQAELEHVRTVKKAYQQFIKTGEHSGMCQSPDQTPKCILFDFVDGPASDQFLTPAP